MEFNILALFFLTNFPFLGIFSLAAVAEIFLKNEVIADEYNEYDKAFENDGDGDGDGDEANYESGSQENGKSGVFVWPDRLNERHSTTITTTTTTTNIVALFLVSLWTVQKDDGDDFDKPKLATPAELGIICYIPISNNCIHPPTSNRKIAFNPNHPPMSAACVARWLLPCDHRMVLTWHHE